LIKLKIDFIFNFINHYFDNIWFDLNIMYIIYDLILRIGVYIYICTQYVYICTIIQVGEGKRNKKN